MKVPSRLSQLLSANQELQGSIKLALHDFEIWFGDRGLVFFPEYTDHGPKHIEEVMTTAEALITDESWRLLTPEDGAVLMLSVILHDCAMHLSEEGFVALVNPPETRPVIAEFGDRTWPELWANFLGEASRFDARKLQALFGDTEPVHEPSLNPRDMTLRDRLLIGEFLRRHHPRLAHEIALWGIPGPGDDRLGLVRVPKGLDDIAGACARSHGMSLRESVEVIPRLNRREHLKVHAPFLMSVLRVADYIQIHSERAPKQILKVRTLKSPVSQGEWKAHGAVEDIHCTHDDPEAIVVVAKPKDVRTFLKLERLLMGLQKELDASWAVLGEVYGRIQGLNELGLTIRRVRSNLDDKAEFAGTVSYYPERIIFEADPEILKLLIAPLYGNMPSIGIRELVQNAVDACLELNDYVSKVSTGRRPKAFLPEAAVLVHLEEGEQDGGGGWLTISDNGIGMTPEVIKNYFLKAGASFRRSEAWKRLHETSPGKSRVLRSGRFGIGLLAAFLLGNRLEVETRHVTCPPGGGVRLSCSIEDEEIELQRCVLDAVGTTIRIRISAEVFRKLNTAGSSYSGEGRGGWDWYHLKTPAVMREVTTRAAGFKKTDSLRPGYRLPSAHSNLPPDWRRIRHEDFEDIHWSYSARASTENNFFCNGIKIGKWDTYSFRDERKVQWPFSLGAPVLSVFDHDGKLPLNLARSALAQILPFERELLADICRDIIAYLLVRTPGRPFSGPGTAKAYGQIGYPGLQGYYARKRHDWFWAAAGGLSLATSQLLRRVSPRNLYIVPRLEALQADIPEEYANVYCPGIDSTLGDFDPWVKFVTTGVSPSGSRSSYAHWLSHVETSGRRIILSTEYESRIKNSRSLPKRIFSEMVEEWRDSNWVVLSSPGCPKPGVEFSHFAPRMRPHITGALAEWYIKSIPSNGEELIIDRVWLEEVGEPLIPFAPDKRKRRLAKAFETLSRYVDSHKTKS